MDESERSETRTGLEHGSIDLGEDLLDAPTRTLAHSGASVAETPEEILKSAKILFSEKLIEESKRLLRQLRREHPDFIPAKELLHEIHEWELEIIFKPQSSRTKKNIPLEEFHVDSEKVLFELDADLGLGIFSELKDEEWEKSLAKEVGEMLKTSSFKDAMDLGIGFLEMGLMTVAGQIFGVARKQVLQEQELDVSKLLEAILLLSVSHLRANRPFEAVLELEQALAQPELESSYLIELLYLLGRAQERLNRVELAVQCYRKALELEPHYRDIEERLHYLPTL